MSGPPLPGLGRLARALLPVNLHPLAITMNLRDALPARSPFFAVTCLEPDGSEHNHILTAREFYLLPKVPVIWNGVPTRLAFRHYHQGIPINHKAMTLLQMASGDTRHEERTLRGPVFVAARSTWFYNFAVAGMEHTVAEMIEGVPLQGEVMIRFLAWDLDHGFEPVSYVSCRSIADFVHLKMLLSG